MSSVPAASVSAAVPASASGIGLSSPGKGTAAAADREAECLRGLELSSFTPIP